MQVGGRQEKGPGKYEREQTKEFGTEKKVFCRQKRKGTVVCWETEREESEDVASFPQSYFPVPSPDQPRRKRNEKEVWDQREPLISGI